MNFFSSRTALCAVLLLAVGGVINPPCAMAKSKSKNKPRVPENLRQTPDSEARLEKWFRDAKYGAFIHFGVYSPLEGIYEGRGEDHQYSEWIQVSAKIPSDEYRRLSLRLNPVEFDAEEWARFFKDAGMRYVVITSKHHDGFALYKSEVSSFNIVDASPFKRDVIKELSEACHRNGLKFGVYYSQAQDWNEPDAPQFGGKLALRHVFHPELPEGYQPDIDRYLREKAVAQVEELVKNYEIDLIWFDTPVKMTYERAQLFTDVIRKYRPDCLISSRLIQGGKKVQAKYLPLYDYLSLRDKEVPEESLSMVVESPDSVSSSYGYKTHGECYYHSEKELMERFIHTVCAGGNYLLNNGPMGNGKLDPEAVRLYTVLGKWLKVNGESIYGTRPSPLAERPAWGDITVTKDGKTYYLHILKWPEGDIELNDLPGSVSGVSFLADGKRISYQQEGTALRIKLLGSAPDKLNAVVKVSFK